MAFTVTGIGPKGSVHFRCDSVTAAVTTAAEMIRVGYTEVSITDATGQQYALDAFRSAFGR